MKDSCIILPFISSETAPKVVWLKWLWEYRSMLNWLADRNIKFKLKWNADGRYFPVSITMDAESAVVFRLVFNV